jgi:hypothetical protein
MSWQLDSSRSKAEAACNLRLTGVVASATKHVPAITAHPWFLAIRSARSLALDSMRRGRRSARSR